MADPVVKPFNPAPLPEGTPLPANPYLQTLQDEEERRKRAAAPVAGNPYLQMLEGAEEARKAQARATVSEAVRVKPDTYAEQRNIAKQLGYPTGVVEVMPEVAKQQAQAQAVQQATAGNPVLERKFTDADFARLAHDDAGTLAKVGEWFTNAAKYLVSAPDSPNTLTGDIGAGVFRASRGAAGVFQAAAELPAPLLDPLEKVTAIGGNPLRRLAEGFAMQGAAAEAKARELSPPQEGVVAGGVSSGVQSLTQNLLMLPLAFLPGGQGAALFGMSAGAGGDAYQKAREQGLPMSQALPFAVSQAAIEYATEKLPLEALLGSVKAGAPLLQTFIKQAGLEIPGEQLATVLQDMNEWAVLPENKDRPFSAYLAERPSAAAQTLIATVVGVGGNVAVANSLERMLGDAQERERAQQSAAALKELLALAAQSKLNQPTRAPESFRELVQEMADGAPDAPKEVRFDARTLVDVLQQAGIDEVGIAQFLPSVLPQLQEAVATGGEVRVPIGEFTSVVGTELEQALLENARIGDNELSQAEAKEAQGKAAEDVKTRGQAIIDQAVAEGQERASVDLVKTRVMEQLAKTGRFTADVNEAYATLHAAFFAAMAARENSTVEAMLERYPLVVQGAPVEGEVLNKEPARPGAISVEGYHFSKQDRQLLSTSFFGTGLQGSARDEIMNSPDARLRERLSFYFDKGTGIRPESGVGGRAHRVQLDNVYDADADPLKLRTGDARAFESKLLDLGYSGYATRLEGTQPGQVIMLGRQTFKPELLGAQSQIQAGQKLEPIKAEPQWQTQAAGTPEQLQARLARMQANPAWAGYDLRIEGNELQVRPKSEVLEQRGVQPAGRAVPASVDAIANVEAAFEFAATQSFPTNRDFKLAVQGRVQAAAKAAKVKLDEFSAATEDYLVRIALADGRTALRTNANAVGWYNEKVTKALRLVSLIHPEIATDPQAKFAFVWAMAVTSNGLKVDKNFELAEQAYLGFKTTGRMPTDIGIGTAAGPINRSLGLYNTLVEKHGFETVERFMTTMQTVKDVEAFTGMKVSGENLTTRVYGAAALGPKIGNGFFMNLYGRFEQLTMDRWLMRTWGRWTGTLVEENPAQVRAKRALIKGLIQSLSPVDKKAFETIIKRKLTVGDIDDVAVAIWKASQKSANRDAMAALGAIDEAGAVRANELLGEPKKGVKRVSFGDELRKAGNALTKYLDGQKEAPAGPPERGNIRKVFSRALAELQKEFPALTMSDFQALLWYPEKRLYDAAKTQDEATDGYEDDEAPDYANAAAKLARAQGVSDADIRAAVAAVDAELSAADRAAGARPGERGARSDLLAQGGLSDGQQQAGDGAGRYSSGSLAPLEGAPTVQGASGPDPRLVAVAEQYALENGIDLRRQGAYVKVDPERAARIAAAYEAMEHAPNDPAVREAYENLARQTLAQYLALQRAGYVFTFFDDSTDPYQGNPWNAMRDLRANQRMAVYGTYAGYGTGSELNVGLADPKGGPNLDPEAVLAAIRAAGGDVSASTVHTSDTEPTLVVTLSRALDDGAAFRLSEALGQEAIAQRFADGSGKLHGPNAAAWGEFNPEFFLLADGRRASEAANPMLADTGLEWPDQNGVMRQVLANDLFRAVHDAFGHGLEGAGFRADGEENAWQAHVRLFTGSAVGAITSETRGQNSWLNYGPHGEANRTAKVEDTIFADQKTGLMPEWTWTEGRAPDEERRPYGNAPDALLGYRKNGPQTPFGQNNYRHVEFVRVVFDDGTELFDAMEGLNKPHAMERARRNWRDAKEITRITRDEAQQIDPDLVTAVDETAQAKAARRDVLEQGAVDQTQTPEFKTWFGDSKAVDENGEPLVVYHGSPTAGWTEFDLERINANDPDGPYNGFFVSTSFEDADAAGRFPWGRPNAKNPETRAFYARMENPATRSQAWDVSREIRNNWEELHPQARSLQDAVRLELQKRGYDAIIHSPYVSPSREAFERDGEVMLGKGSYKLIKEESGYVGLMNGEEYITDFETFEEAVASVGAGTFVLFDPNQLKSATDNSGAFSRGSASILEQRAYHGSPHRGIDKFSTDRIGTGEGAQVFGWGLYFTNTRDIAEFYRKNLSMSRGQFTLVDRKTGEPVAPNTPGYDEVKRQLDIGSDLRDSDIERYKAIWRQTEKVFAEDRPKELAALREQYADDPKRLEIIDGMLAEAAQNAQAARDAVALVDRVRRAAAGQLYEVEIPEDNELLIWDKPIGKQPEKVRAALEALGFPTKEVWVSYDDANGDTVLREFKSRDEARRFVKDNNLKATIKTYDSEKSGERVYKLLSKQMGGDREASLALLEAGVKGTNYPAGSLSGAKSDSRNFVIFSGDDVAIQGQFYQPRPQGPRGTFSPSTNTITLLQSADLSTFLHESAHFFLEVLADMAAQPTASQSLRDDAATLMAWFKVDSLEAWRGMSLSEKRKHHERFAESFEQYLLEGKAPSVELQAPFRRFRAWMINVYKSLKDFLAGRTQTPGGGPEGLQLSPEVRAVFDRMLATEEQIVAMQATRGMTPVFASAEEAGMTPEQWDAYLAENQQATDEAIDRLQARSVRDMKWASNARSRALKALQKEASEKRKAVEAEVRAEVEKEPIYQVQRWLRKGEMTTPEGEEIKAEKGFRFSTAALAEMYPEGMLARPALERLKGMTAANGLHPDLVAEMFGFESGDQLVRQVIDAEAMASVIEGRTDQRMLERYGDLATEAGLQRAADEAVHNEARGRFIATELAALRDGVAGEAVTGTVTKAVDQADRTRTAESRKALRKTNTRVLVKAAKGFAANLVAQRKVRELAAGQHTRAEARSARLAEQALAKGDAKAAAQAKQDQLLSHYAARETQRAMDEVERAVEYLKRFDKEGVYKRLPPEYVDQIHKLLERVDLRAASNKALDKRAKLAEWIKEQEAMGIEPDLPEYLLEDVQLRSYREMTVEEFRGLVDTVRQIEHLGRLKNKLLTAKDQREFAAIRDSIVASILEHGAGRKANTRTPTTNLGRALQGIKHFGAAHVKVATWARVMDGGKDGGPVWEYFVRSANERGDMETEMMAKATLDLSRIMDPLLKRGAMGGKGTYFASIQRSLNREAVLAIALNVGNESNLQRLLGGEGWTMAQLKPVLDTLTKEDWAAVQSIWDYFESYRPLIGEKEKRVFGKEPEWIEPGSSVTAAYGVAGGYYPVKYDPAASQRAEEHADAEGAKRQLQGAYGAATTRRSFTKGRVEEVTGRPLLYTLQGVYSGINDVIHDLAWHEWLIDVNRLMRDRQIDGAMRETYGPEVVRQFKSWRDDIAEGGNSPQAALDGALGKLRQSVSVAGLGFNVVSAMLQPLGLAQSIQRVGFAPVARGIARYVKNPMATGREVNELSKFMASRSRTRFRELNELRNRVQGQTAAKRLINENAYRLMMIFQRMVDVPTWLGAYDKALGEGQTAERAVALADQAVIDAQGGGQVKDLAGIERGGPAQKLFTVFYSFMNTSLNLGVASKMTPRSRAKFAMDMVLLYVVPAVLGSALKDALTPGDAGDDDDEQLAKKLAAEQLSYLLGLVVLGREMGQLASTVTGAEGSRDYTGPAGLRAITDAYQFTKQASQGEFDDAFRKAAVNLAGDIFGLPSAQINRTITGTKALIEDKTDNPAAILTGYQEPR